jgi:hypothetical protein
MPTSDDPDIYKLNGYLGILAKKLKTSVQLDMQEKLTLYTKAWGNAAPTEVEAFHKDNGYFWIPRFFFENCISKRMVGKHPIKFEWANGAPQNLPLNAVLDSKRGQPLAVDRMVAHLQEHSGGILVAPTGCGKTILGYAIGQRLNTSIGVLVYAGHMVDNWIETAKWLFDLGDDDIGLVQRDRCDLGKPVTIMMVQSLLTEKQYPQELYDQFGVIIADEVNRFGAPQWNEVMKLFPARYRVGMSADPKRDDGLDQLVQWHFGKIAHKVVMSRPKPDVIQLLYKKTYHQNSYSDVWKRTPSGDPMPNALKYDKLLVKDEARNEFIVDEMVKMRSKGRKILVFAKLKDHLKLLKAQFEQKWNVLDRMVIALEDESEELEFDANETKITLLVGGLEKRKKDKGKMAEAMAGDVIFCTYAFGRDAMNVPHIDTLILASPAGKVLQVIGRLRDKGPADRRPLLAMDIYEDCGYSRRKAQRRADTYNQLGIKIIHATRTPKPIE